MAYVARDKLYNFATDYDGVIIDFPGFIEKRGEVCFSKPTLSVDTSKTIPKIELVQRELLHPDAYGIEERYECTRFEDRFVFWLPAILYYTGSDIQSIEGATEFFEFLDYLGVNKQLNSSKGYVSSNSPLGILFRHRLFKQLKGYGINFEKENIKLGPERGSAEFKKRSCLELRSGEMAEDKADNIKAISTIDDICVFAHDAPYNHGINGENIIPIYNYHQQKQAFLELLRTEGDIEKARRIAEAIYNTEYSQGKIKSRGGR